MKTYFSNYFDRQVFPFVAVQVFFFACMWLSKSVHPMYFEENNAVANFGLSYSAMALAGYFSFAFGHFTDRVGHRRSLSFGFILYSLGLYIRVFPQIPLIAIMGGIISGLGASISLSALRLWMTSLATNDSLEKMIGIKSSTNAIGTAIGCSFLGLIPIAASSNIIINFRMLLTASAVGMFMLGITIISLPNSLIAPKMKIIAKEFHSPLHGIKKVLHGNLSLIIMATLIGTLTGFYVSFIAPYLPLIMKDKGMTLGAIGLSTSSFALLRFFIDPLIAKFISSRRDNHIIIYIMSEIAIALLTAAFLIQFSPIAFVGLLLLRSCALGYSAITEECLWMRIFPRENLGLFFGLNQSAFFLGDFFGGLANGYLYKYQGLDTCIHLVLGVMIVNLLAFVLFFKPRLKKTSELNEI